MTLYRLETVEGDGIYRDREHNDDGLGFELQGGFSYLDVEHHRPEPPEDFIDRWHGHLFAFKSMKQCLHWFSHLDEYTYSYGYEWVIKRIITEDFLEVDEYQCIYDPKEALRSFTLPKSEIEYFLEEYESLMRDRMISPTINLLRKRYGK